MALFTFSLALYAFDEWSAGAQTNNTVSYPNGRTFSLDADAALSVINVEDDDGNPVGSPGNEFSDGYIDTPGDGSSPSTANNDQVLTQAVTLNGTTFQPGDQVELEFAFTTTTGETFWVIRIDGTNVGISGTQLPVPGTTYTVGSSSDGQETPLDDIPCFAAGAMVATPFGTVPIEKLRSGDLVETEDRGAQPIRWAGKHRPSALELLFFPDLRPIKIAQGALGPNLPNADLVLSPLHRVVISSEQTLLLFGETHVLVPAKALLNGRSVTRDQSHHPTYHHLLLDTHEILTVNGLQAESLYPGTSRLPPRDLLSLDLAGLLPEDAPNFARPTLRHFEARLLAV